MLKRDPADVCLRPLFFVSLLVAALVGATGCSAPRDDSPAARGAADAPAGEAAPHALQNPSLHNLLWVSERIYSGGEPHGEAAFAELARLGVKTIVSVDGARPDVEAARAHGIRYVHIPIGYDGVGDEAGRSLARLVRDAEGPFYIHCHHGRHRGPAAAAVACIASVTPTTRGPARSSSSPVRARTTPASGGMSRRIGRLLPMPSCRSSSRSPRSAPSPPRWRRSIAPTTT